MKRAKDSSTVIFHNAFSGSLSVGTFSTPVSPNSSVISTTRLLSEADGFAHFRVKKLAFRLHPVTGQTGNLAIGYVGGVQDTIPGSLSQVGELLPGTALGSRANVPTPWVSPPKIDLAGPIPWYKTVPGTADATEEQPGFIVISGGGASDPFYLEVRGVIEFKTAVGVGNTPAEVQARQSLRSARVDAGKQRVRERLISVLAPSVQLVPTAK